MIRTAETIRGDALAIWQAGVAAVASDRLMADAVRVEGTRLILVDEAIDLGGVERIAVVGAGKAGAGMAAALETILGPALCESKQLSGWVNVPADCVSPLRRIHLHASRPAGSNEPTAAGVQGSEEILRRVTQLGPRDLCICLISGGASALAPAPVEGITLADKLALTRHLSAAGANIHELNTVRKQLSRIKGGGLARACRAGRLRTLIISDVLGDPLDVIGSGPTVADQSTPADALAVLERYHAREAGIAARVFETLNQAHPARPPLTCDVRNYVIGNNTRAVEAAQREATRRGYLSTTAEPRQVEGEAEEVGRLLAERALAMRAASSPACLVSGGEPVVRLAPEAIRGRGGRNQQLVLAAAERLWSETIGGIVLLSGGTDGEDGPTDAAGAWLDAVLLDQARRLRLDPADFLRRDDAYRFFEPLGGLIRTGPTHTNVCDLRVVLVDRQSG